MVIVVMKNKFLFLLFSLAVSWIEATHLRYEPQTEFLVEDSDEAEVQFLLFTKYTMETPVFSKITDKGELFNGTFDSTKNTKILIHGWLDTWKKEFAQTMLAAFLPKHDVNVIIVNWPEADNIIYPLPRAEVPPVGKIVVRFIERMVEECGMDLASLHVVGHSLGAHVAAVAGYTLGAQSIGRITGLDPAQPLFFVGGQDTLSNTSAVFVEVIHTCGHFMGIFNAIGHVDFYPNGGIPFQPGCLLGLKCSHVRSFYLYAESIVNSTVFVGTECTDWSTYENDGCKNGQKLMMSGETNSSARGMFYFKTASKPPYGLGPDS